MAAGDPVYIDEDGNYKIGYKYPYGQPVGQQISPPWSGYPNVVTTIGSPNITPIPISGSIMWTDPVEASQEPKPPDFHKMGEEMLEKLDKLKNDEIGNLIHSLRHKLLLLSEQQSYTKHGWELFEQLAGLIESLTGMKYDSDN